MTPQISSCAETPCLDGQKKSSVMVSKGCDRVLADCVLCYLPMRHRNKLKKLFFPLKMSVPSSEAKAFKNLQRKYLTTCRLSLSGL